MKTLTVRLPEPLVAEIEVESRGRGCSTSAIVRDRLQRAGFRPGQRRRLGTQAFTEIRKRVHEFRRRLPYAHDRDAS